MTVWRLVANWVLPPPLILFALLSLPLPRCGAAGQQTGAWHGAARCCLLLHAFTYLLSMLLHYRNVKQGMVLFVQKVFDLPIVGRFKL